jgi:hypothetical protein
VANENHRTNESAVITQTPLAPIVTSNRSSADQIARRVLRIPETVAEKSPRNAEKAFQKSMLISAVRCTLTYVVFPFVLPALGIVTSVGPVLGLAIGLIALVCDVFSIRRFFIAEHKYRWHFTIIACAVMALLTVLVVQDVSALLH